MAFFCSVSSVLSSGMEFTSQELESIEKSVLCWLATSSSDHIPNVSPKELFSSFGMNQMVVANLASPQTAKNIRENKNVCVSVLDIFVQKGFQFKGKAKIVPKTSTEFARHNKPLYEMVQDQYPYQELFLITVESSKPIIAPSYWLDTQTTEESQIKAALIAYGINK